ncbi:WD40 repeat-like protein [Coniochaeta ligniaria NRRL 30616]|uniref:WD40 repeat-like protein n=1 Tax=Coniochaeta ligniaria NRRL 30616 TaxID=1408157 RepID=A0A1J7J2U4_9PEZI|nr:WD40 repeat-like protein [Coniochaeta ligniaria NRRL 30616]
MAKRKVQHATEPVANGAPAKKAKAEQPAPKPKTASSSTSQQQHVSTSPSTSTTTTTIQIIAGSYDRILHGITCAIEPPSSSSKTSTPKPAVSFADTFLFTAHTSAIRCLALSPPSAPVPGQSQKVMLATGATDERVNVYNLSAHPPSASSRSAAALLSSAGAPRPILENSSNRELGTLLHHASTVTQLAFPTRGKLLSSSEDSTVAVTRTRDWSLLSSIKSPVPKLVGRPSGDTAAHGAGPRGVNSFAVHPSLKLMISVGKGERCMRLWNLVTGKKAGVLNFGREVLDAIGEGRVGMGEGRRVVWGGAGEEGEEFAVAFDRDVVVFGMDSRPRCRVMGGERTKVHEIEYVKLGQGEEESLLAVSTEDGRVLFFSTRKGDLTEEEEEKDGKKAVLPNAKLVAQLGGKEAGVTSRIKDFKFLAVDGQDGERFWYVVTGSSDGKLRVWKLEAKDLAAAEGKKQVGTLLGAYDTQNRITCVEAFVMIARPEGLEDSEDEFEDEVEAEDAAESGDESD